MRYPFASFAMSLSEQREAAGELANASCSLPAPRSELGVKALLTICADPLPVATIYVSIIEIDFASGSFEITAVENLMPVTIEDLSKTLGVSRSTISKALNDRPDVSPDTKARVLQTVRELGYQPSAAARNLRRQRTSKIGLVVNYPIYRVSDFLAELILGMATAAEESQNNLILYTSLAGSAERITSLCRSREVDGIIIAWPPRLSETVTLARLMNDEEMSHIFLPRRLPHADLSYVATDHVQGARLLTEHLIALGHRRIGFQRLPEVYETDDDRHAGYEQALRDVQIPYDSRLVISEHASDSDYGERALNTFMALPKPPTAILFFTDPVAIKVLALAKGRGIGIPHDLSIAGYDGILSSGVTEPALTTVRQFTAQMGELAVESLLRLIASGGAEPQQRILPVELIARGSTAINPQIGA